MSAAQVDRRLVFYALLAGAASLVPVPLLDDQLLTWVKRRMVRDLGGRRVKPETVRVLSGTTRAWRAEGCLLWVVLLPIRLLLRLILGFFRKLLVLLNLKRAVDAASRTFYEAVVMQEIAGWEASWVADHAAALRALLEQTLEVVDTRPVERALLAAMRGGRRFLRRAASQLVRSRRSGSLHEEEELLDPLARSVAEELAVEGATFSALRERYRTLVEERLGRPG